MAGVISSTILLSLVTVCHCVSVSTQSVHRLSYMTEVETGFESGSNYWLFPGRLGTTINKMDVRKLLAINWNWKLASWHDLGPHISDDETINS